MIYVITYKSNVGFAPRKLYYTGDRWQPGLDIPLRWSDDAGLARRFENSAAAVEQMLSDRTLFSGCRIESLTDADLHSRRLGENAVEEAA